MSRPRRARPGARALAAALLLGVAACAGSPPPSDTFHRLAVPVGAVRSEPLLTGTVEVEPFAAVDALRSRPLAVADPATGALQHARYERWVEAPPTLLQHALADWLRSAGVATEVVTPELRAEPRWWIRGRIERFEWVRGGGAALTLELTLREQASGELRAHGAYALEDPEGGDAAGAAQALGRLAGEAFARFAADVQAALAR